MATLIFLPNSEGDTFWRGKRITRNKGFTIWFLGDLVGDTITEEALPTYESWLMDVKE
jgi:acyl-[acyl-carrier-protein] desaturase